MDTDVCPFTTDIIGFRDPIYIALEHYRLGLGDCQLSNRVAAATADFSWPFQRAWKSFEWHELSGKLYQEPDHHCRRSYTILGSKVATV
jgi:hypothetical protein